jgi:hypothetical protein
MKKLWMCLLFITTSFAAFADEGMWFLMYLKRLNESDMQKKGLRLSAEEIYSINHSSLKDAIVQFNGGCTAEIVSDQGWYSPTITVDMVLLLNFLHQKMII